MITLSKEQSRKVESDLEKKYSMMMGIGYFQN